MRIGAKLPNSGPLPLELGVPAMARALERAGYDSLWVSDHIVLPETIGSRYPFTADGVATWSTDTPYLDALIALALAAAVTERVRLGTAALVLPLRNPVEFAKQAASIDVASGARLELAVGAGWLAEEFAALNVPFEKRGTRLVEWMQLARACWSGRPAPFESERYALPEGTLCLPAPAAPIPLFVGGHSPVALRRAGRVGDGWLAQQSAPELDVETLAGEIAAVRAAASEAGRDPASVRILLRVVDARERLGLVAREMGALARAGVEEVIVDVPVDEDDAASELELLRAGAAA